MNTATHRIARQQRLKGDMFKHTTQQIRCDHFIFIRTHILRHTGAAFHPISSLLLAAQCVLHRTSNRSIRVEVLANHAIARKWSADLLAEVANGAVLGESAADGTLCVESCRSLVGVLGTAGEVLARGELLLYGIGVAMITYVGALSAALPLMIVVLN